MSEKLLKSKRLLRRKQVEEKTGQARSSLYDAMKQGKFPKPINLGMRSVAWLEDEIDAWIDERVNIRNKQNDRK
jgi:prophage regulatory protein